MCTVVTLILPFIDVFNCSFSICVFRLHVSIWCRPHKVANAFSNVPTAATVTIL